MMDPHATCNAVRILSLDGGGIRGLSSLLILEHLMERIREAEGLAQVQRPCDRFDMIGGTSTGGIIAIMLGRLRMTVNECICAYRKMAERAFTPKRTTFLPASPSGAFSAKSLEAAIRDTVKEFCPAAECVARRETGHSTASTCTHGEAEFRSPSCTSTAVLAITKDNVDARPTLFTTYDTSTSLGGCTIWQVARATSAATTFFKPIRVGRDGVEFVDAGFGYNNPCEVLIEEAGWRFPGRDRMQVISIGTGLGDVVSIGDTRIGIINSLKKMATTSRAVAARLDDRFGNEGQYFRFNVEKGLEDTTLSDWKKASSISAHTRNYLSDNKRRVDKFVDAFLRRNWQAERTEGGGISGPESPPRKACRYLPFKKNTKFVGRTSVMETLKRKLFGDDDQTSRSVAIVGLGGVGKTQVALQMAYWTLQNKPEWHIFWVPALSMASFEQACRAIVQMVGLEGADKEDAKELLQHYLDSDTSGRWFLIIDNIDDEEVVEGKEQGMRDFLPLTDRGRILFTTRVHEIAVGLAQTEVIDLSLMEEHEAIELLGKSLINPSLLEDKKTVAELLGILGYLPLAIAQAAAYLNVRKTPVAEYVQLLQHTERDRVELLDTEFTDDTRYSPRRHKTANAVASTWVVSFEQIRKDVDAAMLLSFMTHVESKAIPRSMLPAVGSEQRLTRAVGVLRGYSFLSEREDGLTYDMHRLVHLASRVWLSKQDTAGEQRREALLHLGAIFSTDSWEERERWRQILPHVLKAIKVDAEDRDWVEEESNLRYWVGRCLQAEGRSREAVVVLEQVVAVQETTLAETHPDRLTSQHTLAASVHRRNSVKAVLGYWRDSPVPEPDRKHAVAGSIDVLGRLRTRVQPHTVANEPISEYPLPSEPSANWVKFERIAFADHLVGLDNLQIKEYVRIVTQDDKANELPDQTLVRVAIARAMESGAYDNAATPPAAHGSELPQRRKTSNNSTDINTDLAKLTRGPDLCRSLTGKDLSSTRQPAQSRAMVPVVSLLETRAKVELAKAESAQGRVEKHAKLRQQLDASAVAAASSALNVPTNGCTRSHNHRTRQATPPNSFSATDVVFHDGVEYARGSRGLFIGKLASRGSIISIDGEDYVEYRVLTKPAVF